MMLNKRQVKQLKALANTCKLHYKVGKNEVNDNLLDMLDKALEKYELIKVDVLQVAKEDKEEIANILRDTLHAELIEIRGNVITLYRKNLKEPKIKLSD